jgi:hypothetical protein
MTWDAAGVWAPVGGESKSRRAAGDGRLGHAQ